MRVLVVEDNALLRHHLKVQLQELGHQVDAAEDAREADYYLGEHLPDIAIVDLGLPDEDGLSLIRRWRSGEDNERVKTGIHISINGIAAALRNTG